MWSCMLWAYHLLCMGFFCRTPLKPTQFPAGTKFCLCITSWETAAWNICKKTNTEEMWIVILKFQIKIWDIFYSICLFLFPAFISSVMKLSLMCTKKYEASQRQIFLFQNGNGMNNSLILFVSHFIFKMIMIPKCDSVLVYKRGCQTNNSWIPSFKIY